MDVDVRAQIRTTSRHERVLSHGGKSIDAKNWRYFINRIERDAPKGSGDDVYFVEINEDEIIVSWAEQDSTEVIS